MDRRHENILKSMKDLQVLGDNTLSLFVSHSKPLIGLMWKSLEDPSPLKMFGLSKLSKRRQLTGREEVTGPSLPLSLPLLNCRSGQPTFYIFLPEIGLVSCWEGLLQRKCQLITSIVMAGVDQTSNCRSGKPTFSN